MRTPDDLVPTNIQAPLSTLPKYICHKKVHALKIGQDLVVHTNGSVTLSIADGGCSPVTVSEAVVRRYMPSPGDYLVIYGDGYQSISPAKAFEEGYTRI